MTFDLDSTPNGSLSARASLARASRSLDLGRPMGNDQLTPPIRRGLPGPWLQRLAEWCVGSPTILIVSLRQGRFFDLANALYVSRRAYKLHVNCTFACRLASPCWART